MGGFYTEKDYEKAKELANILWQAQCTRVCPVCKHPTNMEMCPKCLKDVKTVPKK